MSKQIGITNIPDECYEQLSRDVQIAIFKNGIKNIEMVCIENQLDELIGCEFECES